MQSLQDGIYQFDQVQRFGPSTPTLVIIRAGRVARYDWGTYTDVPITPDLERRVMTAIQQRLDEHARWGAPIEFTPTPTFTLHNPVTGAAQVAYRAGGDAA